MSELFTQETWSDGKSKYPGRRRIDYSDSTYKSVNIERDEGTIYEEGDKFDAANMNDLERRINLAFEELDLKINSVGAQLDLYYPVGKIFMSMVNFGLENKDNANLMFPGANSEWNRLIDGRILLPVTTGGEGQTNENVTERQYTFPGTRTITTSTPYVRYTPLTEAQIPGHYHTIVDHWHTNSWGGAGQWEYQSQHIDHMERSGASYVPVYAWDALDTSIDGVKSNSGYLTRTSSTSGPRPLTSGHTHANTVDVKFNVSPANKLQTVQRCIKIYAWQRIK